MHETAHSKTVIIYKKDFVPYTTRIYNFLRPVSGEPGSGDGDKWPRLHHFFIINYERMLSCEEILFIYRIQFYDWGNV